MRRRAWLALVVFVLFALIAGTAGGLSSSLALVVSGSFSILSGFLYRGDFLPVAGLISTSAAMSVVTYRMTR